MGELHDKTQHYLCDKHMLRYHLEQAFPSLGRISQVVEVCGEHPLSAPHTDVWALFDAGGARYTTIVEIKTDTFDGEDALNQLYKQWLSIRPDRAILALTYDIGEAAKRFLQNSDKGLEMLLRVVFVHPKLEVEKWAHGIVLPRRPPQCGRCR